MNIRFYNTLTHRLETFEPIRAGHVDMYTCGPTVYDYAHIGNFRTFLFEDLLRRFLELVGFEVIQVMNITDVGHMTEDQLADGGGKDKMEVAAARFKQAKKQGQLPKGAVEDPDDPRQIAQFYIDAFLEDARALGIKIAYEYPNRMPRASEHITQMLAMIRRLIERDHAYVGADGAVYYALKSFAPYGRLSGNTLDNMRSGAGGRVLDKHQAVKRDPGDFLLWKPDSSHIMKWDSPWGVGYPGWHIECSAMATHVLGRDVIDLHTGAEDNIFPHHECEIAQTCGSTGHDTFARFWMHARYLMVEGEKMSKSRGNFHQVRNILEGKITGRHVEPAVLRYELLRSHYRSNMNFTTKGLRDSARAVRRIRDAAARSPDGCVDISHPVVNRFAEALADDLNVAAALAVVFDWLKIADTTTEEAGGVFQRIDSVLGILPRPGAQTATTIQASKQVCGDRNKTIGSTDKHAAQLCRQINAARADGQYTTADRLRQQLLDAGYEVQTTRQGTTARKKLA